MQRSRGGTDFLRHGDYLVFLNKNALTVIPESLKLGPVEYFTKLSQGALFEKSDKGIEEKLRRSIGNKMGRLTAAEEKIILAIVRKSLVTRGKVNAPLAAAWFSTKISAKYPDLAKKVVFADAAAGAEYILSQPHFADHPEWVERVLEKGAEKAEWAGDTMLRGGHRSLALYALSQPHWKDRPDFLWALIEKGTADQDIVSHVLTEPHWRTHPEFVKALLKIRALRDPITAYLLPSWIEHPEFVEEVIPDQGFQVARCILSGPEWARYPHLLKMLIEDGDADQTIVRAVLTPAHWKNHPELVLALINKKTPIPPNARAAAIAVDKELAKVLALPHWAGNPELVAALAKKKTCSAELRALTK